MWWSSAHISSLVLFLCKGRSTRVSLHEVRCTSARAKSCSLWNSRSQASASEEEGLACRRQDISSCCRCCAHFLQLFPAVSCSERSAGVEQAPPSIIILPSPATHPPSADNRTSPPSPFSPRSHCRLQPFVISHPLSFSSFMIFTSFYSPSVPPVSLPDWPFYLSLFTFLVVSCIFFTEAQETLGSVTRRPIVEAAADLWIARETAHTHRCLCRPIPFTQRTLSNFEPEGGLMCVRNAV